MKHFAYRNFKIKIFFAALMSMIASDVFAYDFEVDGFYYNIVSISDLSCEVTYGESQRHTYSGDITIPSTVTYKGKNLKVVGIGDYAFDNISENEPITSIILPDGIEYIGEYALAGNSFTDIKLPKSLKTIRSNAFLWTNDIKRVYINSIKSWCEIDFKNYESSPFCYGKKMISLDTDDGLYTAEGELYLNDAICEEIMIPNEISQINNYAFAGIASIKEVILPEGIESIGDYAFCNCINLKLIKTPTTCKSVGKHAFNNCRNITKVELSEGLENIGERAFSYCTSLPSLIFPSTIVSIGKYMFYGMNLAHLRITHSDSPLYCPESSLFNVESVDFQREFICRYVWVIYGGGPYGDLIDSPFSGYQDGYKNILKNVMVGPNVKELHRKVFEGCRLDSVVICDSNLPLLLGYERADSTNYNSSQSYSCESVFYSIPISNLYIGRPLEVNETELRQGAKYQNARYRLYDFFEKCITFKGIEFGNTVTDISYLKFDEYKDLSNIVLGSGIANVPDLSVNEKLNSITVINSTPPTAVAFANKTYLDCKLYVPKGCKVAYESANVWKNFWNIVEIDPNTLGIEKLSRDSAKEEEIARYGIDGTKLNTPKKGINIIRTSDGRTRKVYVK